MLFVLRALCVAAVCGYSATARADDATWQAASSAGCTASRASTAGMIFVVIAVAFAVLGRRSVKLAALVACAGVVALLVANAASAL